ncbi:phosphate/phosphite/phosphonate ABC transporter substrate-binding protein [Spirosoma arcticum]
MKTKRINVLLCGLLIALCFACGGPDQQADGNPKKLRFGLLVSEETEQTFERMEILQAYFSEKLGREVEFLQMSNTSAIIEAMRANKIDVSTAGAFTYLVASKTFGAEAIATTRATDGNPRYYTSCLITSSKSSLRNIDDVIKNAKNITLSWAYPTSTSGHLVPRYYLQQRGIMPDDFKEVFTSTNHTATLFSVLSGKVDVAAITYALIDRFIKTGKLKKGDLRIIWESEPIAPSPVFVRKGLDEGLKKRIQQAYLDVSKGNPKAMKALQSQFTYGVGYIPVNDSFYQPLRDMANKVEGLTLEE